MCFAAIAAGAGAVGGIVNMAQGASAASAATAFDEEMAEKQRALAQRSAVLQQNQIDTRLQQEQAAAAQEISNITSKSRSAKATALVAGLEGGGTGQSFDALLTDFEAQELDFVNTVQRNLAFKEQQAIAEKEGVTLGLEKSFVSTTVTPTPGPDFLGGSLNIVGGLASNISKGAFSKAKNFG